MEPLEKTIAEVLNESEAVSIDVAGPAHILLVGGDAAFRGALTCAVKRRKHALTCAGSLHDARHALDRTQFDVIVIHCTLSDGDGLELAPLVQEKSPSTKIIAVCQTLSPGLAVRAMRSGAVDIIDLPIEQDDLAGRIESALLKSRTDVQREQRVTRLKKICRELNVARHEITKQVDALCNDLVNAYQEIAEQMNDVAMAAEFRTLLKQELDVEELLRTTLEYVLTKTGPTNAAVFLPDAPRAREGEPRHYGLGAYVNFDCPRETISLLLDHLGQAICPQMAQEKEIVAFSDSREFAQWIGADANILSECQVIAFSCLHEDDCLAVIVLFRNKSNPFNEKLAGVIDTLREIIAEQLSQVIKVHHRARPSWPKEAEEGDLDYHDDDLGFDVEGGLAA